MYDVFVGLQNYILFLFDDLNATYFNKHYFGKTRLIKTPPFVNVLASNV